MKRIMLFLVSIACCFQIQSCKDNEPITPPPIACFSPSKRLVKAGTAINLENCSQYVQDYYWEFGDGTVSNVKSPTHTFNEAGMYEIRLYACSIIDLTTFCDQATTTIEVRENSN